MNLMNRSVLPPSCDVSAGHRFDRLVCCVAEGAGCVFVEGADVDSHASVVKGRGWASGQECRTERGSSSGVPLNA